LLALPGFVPVAAVVVKALVFLIPLGWLAAVVSFVVGMPASAADVTAKFIKSSMGVRQALYMAKDEMEMVKEDLWGEGIWEASHSAGAASGLPLVLYYGEQVSNVWASVFTIRLTYLRTSGSQITVETN
jgi:hypothetical protein